MSKKKNQNTRKREFKVEEKCQELKIEHSAFDSQAKETAVIAITRA